jgi:uncharacterized protein (TIGR02246 family)
MRPVVFALFCAAAFPAFADPSEDPAHYGGRHPDTAGSTVTPLPADVLSALSDFQHPEAEALRAFALSWQRAFEAGDFAALAAHYEPDAWLVTAHQPARKGRDLILTYLRAARAEGATPRFRFEQESLEIDGDYAFRTAQWWLSVLRANGTTLNDSGRSFAVLRRGADGHWRLWRDINTPTPDVGPVTAETFP